MKSVLLILLLIFVVNATRLHDFADSIPAGQWTVFPTPSLTSAMIASPPSGTSLAYNQQAVWDSISNRLMNIGAAHGSGMSRAILYDATTDNWRNILTPREPATNTNRLGHTWDHLTGVPDSGVAYTATYTAGGGYPDSNYFFKYTFATDKWDTMRNAIKTDFEVYAGAIEYVPEWHGIAMLSGNGHTKGAFLDLNVPNPNWTNLPGLAGAYALEGILDYNPVFKTLLCVNGTNWKIMDVNKNSRNINPTPFNANSLPTKIITEPTTGTYLAFNATEKNLYAYDMGQDLWQVMAAGNQSALANVNVESIIFKVEEYGIVGIITAEPRCLVLKYTPKFDTTLTDLNVTASKSSIEEWADTTALTVIATRQANGGDTVTRTCFYTSLDTAVARTLSGGKVIAAPNSVRGNARIMVTKNTAKGIWRDTITIAVVATSSALDSVKLNQDSLTLLVGDRFPLILTAYYHVGTLVISRQMDTSDVWSSDNPSVAPCVRAQIRAQTVGLAKVRVTMAGRKDSVAIRVMAKPTLLKRIDFLGYSQGTQVFGWSQDWAIDDGYNASRGYGYTDGNAGGWSWNLSDNNGSVTNYLIKNASSPYERTGSYKVNVPDGEYVVRICKGPSWGGAWISYGSDTLIKTTSNNAVIKTDTLTVSGGTGLNFKNYGYLAYMIVMSNDGTDIDSVAWDKEPLVFIGDSAFNALNRDTTTWTSSEGSLQALDETEEHSLDLVAIPNPFNPSTVLHYQLPFKGSANLTIFDLRGMRVQEYGLKKTKGSVVWDGRNSKGESMPTGCYFARLKAGNKTLVHRLFMVK